MSTDDWRHRAVCRDEETSLFFPKGNTGPWLLVIEEAKAVCRTCPVMQNCGEWALEQRIQEGIWGGLDEAERRSILRRRSRNKTHERQQATETAA